MNIKVGIGAAFVGLCGFFMITDPHTRPLKVEWMNDAVILRTNTMAWDEERNKGLTNSPFFYTKTVIETNRVKPVHFLFGDRGVEFGVREDGVVVWR